MTGSYRILALLSRVETAHPVLATAGLLASRLRDARIDVLHVRPKVDPGFMPTEEVMTESREHQFEAREDESSADLKGIFDAWQREAREAAAWREVVGGMKAAIVAESSRTDLIVIGHAAPHSDESSREAIQAALFDAKAAVVLVPDTVPHEVGRHIAVAWKPSEAADRAIEAALPVLLRAERVTVLIAAEDGIRDATLRALHTALAPQDSRLEIHPFAPGSRSIGDALVSEAMSVGADLLVMGAYTHYRLLDTLLGGATRDIIAEAGLPVLMRH